MHAQAGIQKHLKILDSRLRGNDAKGGFKTFYETINICGPPATDLFYFATNELPRGKLRGIKPGRFRNLHPKIIGICVICLPCEMRSLFLWGEICGLKFFQW
jgi:hypothetical protein